MLQYTFLLEYLKCARTIGNYVSVTGQLLEIVNNRSQCKM